MSWFEDIFRNLAFLLDNIVYTLINWVYGLFISIAQINISDAIIDNFASRIYALLGIFMLFRLAFSLITYLINPDNMKDNKNGGGAMIKNVFLCILLMALVPTIFREAYDLQKIILEEDIIGQIVMGKKLTGNQDENLKNRQNDTTGKTMAFTVFSAFFTPNVEDGACDIIFDEDGLSDSCKNAEGFSGTDEANTYEQAYQNLNNDDLSPIGTLSTVINSKREDGAYMFNYQAFISTIAGGFVAWILMIFCIDVSLRVVKLAFLQLIAPIPVISYIDPKNGADGMFKKWYTTCFKTYADVFIRLLAIYFAIYMVNLLTSTPDAFQINGQPLSLVQKLFVILGVLMFAKQLPDLLKDLLGIDLKGNFTLNPLKKIEDNALFGKNITGATAGFMARGVPGMFSGLFSGQGFSETKHNQIERRHALQNARYNGSNFGERMRERTRMMLGRDTEVDRINRRENELADQEARIDKAQEEGRAQIAANKKVSDFVDKMEDRAVNKIKNNEAGRLSRKYLNAQSLIEKTKLKRDKAIEEGNDGDARRYTAELTRQTMALDEWLNGAAKYDYIDNSGIKGSGAEFEDDDMINLQDSYEAMARQYKQTVETTAKERHSHSKNNKNRNASIERSFISGDAEKEKIADEKKKLANDKRVAEANLSAIGSMRNKK